MKITCCKDCIPPKRHMHCHSTCEEYIKQSNALKEDNERKRQEKQMDYALTYKRRRVWNAINAKRHGY